jgi:hypothetical protein
MTYKADTLFICANFFGYAGEIRRQLERRGRVVAHFEDRPATDSLTKALIRISPAVLRARADGYFEGIMAQMAALPIKDVLVIKGEAMSPSAVKRLRMLFPHAKFTLYFWDSFRNMPADSKKKALLFDRVLTFDPGDAAADSRLIYRPLFFLEEHTQMPDAIRDIDVLFYGTLHGDRYSVLKRIEHALPRDIRFEKVLYLPARWMRVARCLEDPGIIWAGSREFIYSPKNKNEIAALVARSGIVVDIERPIQRGYTMRTAEVLGAGRKLITTNAAVATAEFYNPANIAVVDRNAPVIPKDFLTAPYEPPPPEILRRYSIEGWLDDVMPQTRRSEH